ncbi:hypothetical protein [Tenacibaculum sp.]|uniref:hypothetical protein n=1 Tax=Tenacibaculum sp. TaxID=1906242 RepID=UPI003D0F61C6
MSKKLENIKIVKIVDQYQIVINKGSNDGITDYMNFLVYEEGEEIIDPETKESLGVLEIAKGKLRVKHVQKSLTTLESDDFEIETLRKVFSFAEFIDKRKQKPLKGIQLSDKIKII